jgi:predicted transglutaminase-like protease
MEAHQPHYPTHKKKWSEYIFEFVLLFTAVTLGFFAENVREHINMIESREQNLVSILEDLKQDSIYLASTIKISDDGIRYF